MARVATPQHEIFHAEALSWMLSQLDESERAEFIDGFVPLAVRFESLKTVPADQLDTSEVMGLFNDVSAFINDWQVSLQLAATPEWVKQVSEAERLWANSDREDVGSAEEIRQAVRT